jgi:hypothetical protein
MKLNDPIHFGYSFAGLFEGDGHIVCVEKSTLVKKRVNPVFCITFHIKDLPLAEFIKKKLFSVEFG